MKFFNISPLEGENGVYVGEAQIFSIDPIKVTVSLPFDDTLAKKTKLFVRDGKLYVAYTDKPIEVRVPEELIKCKKEADTALCEIEPVVEDLLSVAEWNSSDGWHIKEVAKMPDCDDCYRIEGINGDKYVVSTETLLGDGYTGKYLSLFKEDGQLKGIVVFKFDENPNKVLMYKVNIPKEALKLEMENQSTGEKVGIISFP